MSISQPADRQYGTPAGPAPDPTRVIDCKGQRCPMPVIVLARQITQVPVGAVLRVIADDPAAAYDVPAWCRMRGQEYLASTPAGDGSPGAGGPAVAYDIRRVS